MQDFCTSKEVPKAEEMGNRLLFIIGQSFTRNFALVYHYIINIFMSHEEVKTAKK